LNYISRPIVDIEINKVSIFVEAEALTRSNRSSTFSLGEAENLISLSSGSKFRKDAANEKK